MATIIREFETSYGKISKQKHCFVYSKQNPVYDAICISDNFKIKRAFLLIKTNPTQSETLMNI